MRRHAEDPPPAPRFRAGVNPVHPRYPPFGGQYGPSAASAFQYHPSTQQYAHPYAPPPFQYHPSAPFLAPQYSAFQYAAPQQPLPPGQYVQYPAQETQCAAVEQHSAGGRWLADVEENDEPSKRRRLREDGTYQMLERLGVGPSDGGRYIFIEDTACKVAVPPSIDNSLSLWKWLKSMQLEEVLNCEETWQLMYEPATPTELTHSFQLHVRRRPQLQPLVPCQHKEGYSETCIAKSALVTSKVEDCPELVYWTEQVVNRGVPTIINSVDELLQPLRPLVADVRYLHFLLVDARDQSVDAVVKMRGSRYKGQNDLEVPYHPLLLCFCKAAAAGQPEVNFFGEVHAGKAREDICLQVNGISEPSEVKAAFQKAYPGDAASGIDRNKAAFAKMLKCNTENPQPWHLGFFAERIERVWFALFDYAEDGNVKSIRVAPEFPCSDVWDNRNRLFDIRRQLDRPETTISTLRDAAPTCPSPGFNLLVRYVDTLCVKRGIPLLEIELILDEVGDSLDLSEATVVARGSKSLVLRTVSEELGFKHERCVADGTVSNVVKGEPMINHEVAIQAVPDRTGSNVVKISGELLIEQERAIHAAADGAPFIRPMVAGLYGSVEGAGEGLRWLALRGFGRHVTQNDLVLRYLELWESGEAAVHGLHARGVLHRDIKPANFLIIDDKLALNDFDASCLIDDPAVILQQRVGTPIFESPFRRKEQAYQYRDDWSSLVLTFLSLQRFYTAGANKEATMRRAQRSPNVQAKVQACIRWIFSDTAARGGIRQPLGVVNSL